MAPETSAIRASKRKRNQISYSADDYFDSIDFAADEQDVEKDAAVESDHDEGIDSNEADGTFNGYSNGKAPKKKKVKKTPKAKKPKAVKPFRFMDLPAELRDQIYDLALTEPAGMTVVSRTKGLRRIVQRGMIAIEEGTHYSGKQQPAYRGFWGHRMRVASDATYIGTGRRANLTPNLCAVNRQLREEASSILYKQEIVLEDTTALHVFVTAIGSFNRQLLAQVTVKGWGIRKSTKSHNFAAFAAMTECVNLQSLFLDCSIGYSSSAPEIAKQIYKDAHFFLEAYGSANGSYDAAVDVLELSDFHFREKATDATSTTFNEKATKANSTTFSEKKYDEFEATLRSHLKR